MNLILVWLITDPLFKLITFRYFVKYFLLVIWKKKPSSLISNVNLYFLFLPYKYQVLFLWLYNLSSSLTFCGWWLWETMTVRSLFTSRSYTGQMTPENPWSGRSESVEMSQPRPSRGWKRTPFTLPPSELTTLAEQGPQAPQSMSPPKSLVSMPTSQGPWFICEQKHMPLLRLHFILPTSPFHWLLCLVEWFVH